MGFLGLLSKGPEVGDNPYQSCIIPNTGDYDRLRASGSPEKVIRKRKADGDKASAKEDRLQQEAWDREFPHDISGQSYRGNCLPEDDKWDELTTQINEWTKEGKTPQQILESRQDMHLGAKYEREEIARAFAEEDKLQQGTWDRRFPTVEPKIQGSVVQLPHPCYHENGCLKRDRRRRLEH
ncbi:MAG: hypothetical protein LQ350_006873 [Teloschistes chrysophthalmus]|nr:MAG: hypothetical protein LQ350_006873 [Niorma chrysophthalma]